jgi:hypothetical protein
MRRASPKPLLRRLLVILPEITEGRAPAQAEGGVGGCRERDLTSTER